MDIIPKEKNKWGRRKFLASLGILGAAGISAVSANAVKNIVTEEKPPVLKAGPYLQFTGRNEMVVRWLTHVPCYSWVEYGVQADSIDLKAEVVNDGLIKAYNTVHAITLRNLNPDSVCYYRICSKEIETFEPYKVVFGRTYVSPVYSFHLTPEQANQTSFLVFNDIHDTPESFGKLMKFQSSGQKDFMVFNGDIFNYMVGEDQIVRNLLQPFSEIFPSVPFVFSRGNHETRGHFARHLPEYFNRSGSGFYFSFVAGPVYCLVLDSGEDKPDDDREYFGLVSFDSYRLAQREWLKNEITKSAFKMARYKIVFSHIPLFYSGEWHGTIHCRQMWADILNEAKIDVLISGHTHKCGIYPRVDGTHNYPVVIGGGPKDGQKTIIEVVADERSLQLKLIDDNGDMKGELSI